MSEWKDWPAAPGFSQSELAKVLAKTHVLSTEPMPEPLYVIAKSDSIEHLYYREIGDKAQWVPLALAGQYSLDTVRAMPEPHDGFWMDLTRAQELEQ